MKNISAIQDIERAQEQLSQINRSSDIIINDRLYIAKLNLSIALDKLKELEIKIRNL